VADPDIIQDKIDLDSYVLKGQQPNFGWPHMHFSVDKADPDRFNVLNDMINSIRVRQSLDYVNH
jgi:hypothetical protein